MPLQDIYHPGYNHATTELSKASYFSNFIS